MEINTNPHDRTDLQLADPKAPKQFQERRHRLQQQRKKEFLESQAQKKAEKANPAT